MSAAPAETWNVVCLCAAWCGVCREWRAAFERAAAAFPSHRFDWVDVEDEADAIGDVDIETFPTVLVAQGGRARFLGPLPPTPGQLERLLASLADDPRAGMPVASEAGALVDRLTRAALLKR